MSVAELPILYSFRRCPYAMRARMALLVSGQQCELREVDLKHKPQAMVDASPKATVPVLVLPDSSVIEQSLDIMLWTLNNNDPEHWLQPEVGTLDEMLALIHQTKSHTNDNFKYHLDRYKYAVRYDGADALSHRDHATDYLNKLEKRLSQSTYFFGDRLSLADIAIFPFVRQFANTDHDWFEAQSWQQLARWLDGLVSSELFAQVMEKHQPWQDGDPVVVFPGSTSDF